jgi:RimJ/RimL family protein N-acetyltransferase
VIEERWGHYHHTWARKRRATESGNDQIPPPPRRLQRRGMGLSPRFASRAGVNGVPTVLRDGSTVMVRPVQSTDASLLADGFTRLSERSRRLRFLGDKNNLTVAELRYLTCIDHHDHEALGALSPDGRGIGVARYVRDSEDPGRAEVAVTVVDEWHGRGLGTKLLELLSDRARAEGVDRFTATVASDNMASSRLVRSAGGVLVSGSLSTREYEIRLVPPIEQGLTGWLRELDAGLAGAWQGRGERGQTTPLPAPEGLRELNRSDSRQQR